MEGKTVILSVFIMSLVLGQIQVEAVKVCCPSPDARNNFNICRLFEGKSRETCLARSGCKLKNSDGTCPSGYTKDILENSGDDVNEYCKVGCVSSVCSALTTLQNSDASEIVTGAINQCVKACSTFCTKGSMNAVEIA